jgi:hypothetical protein
LVECAIDIYKGLHHGANSEIPKEFKEQKNSVYQQLETLEKGCTALHDLCGKEEEKVREIKCSYIVLLHVALSYKIFLLILLCILIETLDRQSWSLEANGMSPLYPKCPNITALPKSSKLTINMPNSNLTVAIMKPPAS